MKTFDEVEDEDDFENAANVATAGALASTTFGARSLKRPASEMCTTCVRARWAILSWLMRTSRSMQT